VSQTMLNNYRDEIVRLTRETIQREKLGKIKKVTGAMLEVSFQGLEVGALVEILLPQGPLLGEVVGFREGHFFVVPFGDSGGIFPGAFVRKKSNAPGLFISERLLGRVLDPFGRPLDGKPLSQSGTWLSHISAAPSPESRAPIHQRLDTGVRVIDGLLTCGRGQRVGLFAGAGVGKTTLIKQISRQCNADVVVLGLIGERGCEVQDALEELDHRTIVVAATSDRSPIERIRGAQAATTIAEYFRAKKKHVLLVIDSLTRYAMALREIGLSAGEPPTTKGYPPSVFASLPRLLERVAPLSDGGSITAFYTVLVEGDDLSDPISDSARSLLDGHFVLSRDVAAKGIFPAVDVLASTSRVVHKVTKATEQQLMQKARTLLSLKREAEELRSLGAYTPGVNPSYDRALQLGVKVEHWSRQADRESCPYTQTIQALSQLLENYKE
jgi:flagellum-specific ATP synthase